MASGREAVKRLLVGKQKVPHSTQMDGNRVMSELPAVTVSSNEVQYILI